MYAAHLCSDRVSRSCPYASYAYMRVWKIPLIHATQACTDEGPKIFKNPVLICKIREDCEIVVISPNSSVRVIIEIARKSTTRLYTLRVYDLGYNDL